MDWLSSSIAFISSISSRLTEKTSTEAKLKSFFSLSICFSSFCSTAFPRSFLLMSEEFDELVLCRFNGGLPLPLVCIGLDREDLLDSSDNLGTLLSISEVPDGNVDAIISIS